ncbi:MAG TPA: hypothetical protein VGO52_06705 [Hyphomonadaceae bacterium]|jgi:hypothetical protein|nr:hypothetical protein [Hyphomonadaceae bacterium]
MIYRSPLEHDEEYIRLLGVITARWSLLEEGMIYFLGELLGDDDTAREMYLSTGAFRQRTELIKAACTVQILDPEWRDRAHRMLATAYDAFKVRNRMVHSSYHALIETPEKDRLTTPFITGDPVKDGGVIRWIGQGHPGNPTRINKGAYKSHLEKLNVILTELVEIADGFKPGKRLLKWQRPPRRKKPSDPQAPQGGTAPKRPRRASSE